MLRDIRGELEGLFYSWEREWELKIIFPFYGKGTGIKDCIPFLQEGNRNGIFQQEGKFDAAIPGNGGKRE